MPALHPAGGRPGNGPPQHGERMQTQRPFAGILAVACALALAGCAEVATTGGAGRSGGSGDEATLRIEMVQAEAPSVFAREGVGRREPEGSAAGLWASVAGLPRAERGRLRNLATGAEVIVALFVAPRGTDPQLIRVSTEAAEALGIGAGESAPVAVVALRREARVSAAGSD
jgi:hypothetical protein